MGNTHTNVAPLWFAASHILQATGRLQEHELWDNDPDHRAFIDRELMEAARQIADWLGFDLVKRPAVAVPSEEAA